MSHRGLSRAVAPAVVAAVVLTGCTRTVPGDGELDPAAAPAPTTAGPTAGPTTRPTTGPTTGPTTVPTAVPTGTASTAAAACPGAGVATRDADLAAALPATTPRGLPVRADRSGARTLDQIVSGYEEPERGRIRRELIAAGFRDAFERTWAAGTAGTSDRKLEVLVVYRFVDPAGACRYRAGELARSGLEPIPVPSVPGAVGVATTSGDIRTAVAEATKGAYLVEADALSYSTPVDFWTAELLRAAYATL